MEFQLNIFYKENAILDTNASNVVKLYTFCYPKGKIRFCKTFPFEFVRTRLSLNDGGTDCNLKFTTSDMIIQSRKVGR